MSRKRRHLADQGTQPVAKKHTSAVQKAQKAIAAVQLRAKPLVTLKPVRTATQSQTQTITPEVQQLVADLIMKGPDMPHMKKMTAATSAGKLTATMSTKTQLCQKSAMVTIPDLLQIISIDDDDEPTLTMNVTTMIRSILDTAMMEEDESPKSKQLHLMQESIDKLLQGCGSEQDLQEKITKLTLEWDVTMNNAAVNLWQYENLQKENTKLAEEFSKLKKLQGSGEMAPIIQKLKQQIMERDNTIAKQQKEINDISTAHNKTDTELATLRAEYGKLKQQHIAQKHELNTARDNIDTLIDDNNKAQELIMTLMTMVQSKQNSYDDLSTAHTNLQTQFDTLKNSMDTLDKQQLIKTTVKATGEAM